MKLVLKKPIQIGDDTVTELNFREEICSGDIRGVKLALMSDGDLSPLFTVAGRLCGQVDVVMNRLGGHDTQAIIGLLKPMLADFLGAGQDFPSTTALQ